MNRLFEMIHEILAEDRDYLKGGVILPSRLIGRVLSLGQRNPWS